MRIANTVNDSIVDGHGLRFTIFTQGCPHHCPGCHNPDTHDPAGGRAVGVEELAETMGSNPLTDGLTLSGGEPFCQPEALLPLARGAREQGKDVTIYSGYTLEQLLEMAKDRPAILDLLHACDILVDGPYVEELRDLTLTFRGSSNQRILVLKEVLPPQQKKP